MDNLETRILDAKACIRELQRHRSELIGAVEDLGGSPSSSCIVRLSDLRLIGAYRFLHNLEGRRDDTQETPNP